MQKGEICWLTMALNCAKLLALFDFEKILYENKGKTALVKKLITNTSAGQIENINYLCISAVFNLWFYRQQKFKYKTQSSQFSEIPSHENKTITDTDSHTIFSL